MDILGYKEYLQNHPENASEYLDTILDAVKKVKQCSVSFAQTASEFFLVNGEIKLKVFSVVLRIIYTPYHITIFCAIGLEFVFLAEHISL